MTLFIANLWNNVFIKYFRSNLILLHNYYLKKKIVASFKFILLEFLWLQTLKVVFWWEFTLGFNFNCCFYFCHSYCNYRQVNYLLSKFIMCAWVYFSCVVFNRKILSGLLSFVVVTCLFIFKLFDDNIRFIFID